MIGLLHLELRRLATMRATVVTALAAALLVWIAPGSSNAPEGVATNMWDQVVGFLNYPFFAVITCLTSCVVALGAPPRRADGQIDALVAVRVEWATWWIAKTIALICVGAIVSLALWAGLVTAAATSEGIAWQLSPWGSAPFDPLVGGLPSFRIHSPPPLAGLPVLGTALQALYTGIGSAGVVIVAVSLLQHASHTWSIMVATTTLCLLGIAVNISVLNPLTHIIWSAHQPGRGGHMRWYAVIPAIAVVAVAAGVVGPRRFKRVLGAP